VIVAHEGYLSRITDIAEHHEFLDRKTKKRSHDIEIFDWWISDFTLKELMTLRVI